MPSTGQPSANASARATAMPARNPVKLPGPSVTTTSSMSRHDQPACGQYFPQQRQQALGMAARQRLRRRADSSAPSCAAAAEIAAPEVSKASRRKVDQEIARTSTTSGT